MRKKALCFILSITMLTTLIPTIAFANNNGALTETSLSESELVEEQAAVIEGVVGTKDIEGDIIETGDAYVAENECDSLVIPKDGEEPILVISDTSEESNESQEIIGINLPNIVDESGASTSENGTIIYQTNEEAFMAVQALEERVDNEVFQAVCMMVAINDETAPTEYEYEFDLPKGYSLVSDYDFDNELDPYDCGAIFIVNGSGQISSTIEPAWAIDNNGNAVDTQYIINGNSLIQTVEFDENSAFPIVADPKQLSKTKTFTNTKKNNATGRNWVKARRNEINNRQNSSISTVRDILCSIVGIASTALGIATTLLSVGNITKSAFLEKCEDEFTTIYEKMTSDSTIKSVTIKEVYKGIYVKHAKAYRWTAQVPTHSFTR